MTSERYLAIMRPIIHNLLSMAQSDAVSTDDQTAFQFKMHYGVEGVTRREYIQAVKWLVDALDNAQVIVRLDIKASESAGGDDEQR